MFTLIASYGVMTTLYTFILFKNSKNLYKIKNELSYMSLLLVVIGVIGTLLSSIFGVVVFSLLSLGWLFSFFHFQNYEQKDIEKIFEHYNDNKKKIKTEEDEETDIVNVIIEKVDEYKTLIIDTLFPHFKMIYEFVVEKSKTIFTKKKKKYHSNANDDFWTKKIKESRIPDYRNAPPPPRPTNSRKINKEKYQDYKDTLEDIIGDETYKSYIKEKDEEVINEGVDDYYTDGKVDAEKFFNHANTKRETYEDYNLTPEEIRIKKIMDLFAKKK